MILVKKDKIIIPYDSEKLSALKRYMSGKGIDFNEELEKSVDTLYKRYIPASVREYIDMKIQDDIPEKVSKPRVKKKEVNDDGKSED